jgi:hypothetical protein
MARIVWKPDHREIVARRSFTLLRDPLFSGTELAAVRQAMREKLEPALHRDLTGMQQIEPWIREIWKALENNGFIADEPVIKPVVDHAAERMHQAVTVKLSEISLMDLMGELATRIEAVTDMRHLRAIMREEANAVLDRRMPGILPADPLLVVEEEPEAAPSAKLFHVCLIGLDGKQKEIMRQAYKGVIDFHFLDGNEGQTRIKNMVAQMDFTVCSRWPKGQIGSTKGWANYSTSSGGMDSIHTLIRTKFKLH